MHHSRLFFLVLGLLPFPASLAQEKSVELLILEVAHPATDCPALKTNQCCFEDKHWRINAGKEAVADEVALDALLKSMAQRSRAPIESLPEAKILIRVDPRASFARVRNVMASCSKVGLNRIEFSRGDAPAKESRFPFPSLLPLKAPEAVTLNARWVEGALESRIGQMDWTRSDRELREQIRRSGAFSQTRIVLDLESEIPWSAAVDIMDLLHEGGYNRTDFATPLESKNSFDVPPAKEVKRTSDPVLLEIVHTGKDCQAYAKEKVCPIAAHWSIRVDQAPATDPSSLRRFLESEAKRGINPKDALFLSRPLLIWAEAKAPYGIVSEMMVSGAAAGFLDLDYEFGCEWGWVEDPWPDPGPKPVTRKPGDQTRATASLTLRWNGTATETSVNGSPWTSTEEGLMEILRSAQVGEETRLSFAPAVDAPWFAVFRVKALLKTWGFSEPQYIAPCFPWSGAPSPLPVSEAEAADFARSVERAYRDGDVDTFHRLFDREASLALAIGKVSLSVQMRVLIAQVGATGYLPPPKRRETGESAALRFISMKQVNGAVLPVLRLLLPDRFDYIELVVNKTSGGYLRVVDYYSQAGGDLFSGVIRSTCLPGAEHLGKLNSFRAPLLGDVVSCLGRYGGMAELFMAKRAKEALEFFKENESELKSDSAAQRLRIQIAQSVSPEEHLKALIGANRDLPDDSSLLFRRIQQHLLARECAQGLEAIEALDRTVNGDPFLDVLRARLLLDAKEFDKAQAAAEKATVREPDLDQGWWMAIDAAAARKDYRRATRLLSGAEDALQMRVGDLSRSPKYEGLAGSPEYREWLKSR